MTDDFQRRDLTELRASSLIFDVSAKVDQSGNGLCDITYDGDTIQVPVSDLPELSDMLLRAHQLASSGGKGTPPAKPPKQPPSHPAGRAIGTPPRLRAVEKPDTE